MVHLSVASYRDFFNVIGGVHERGVRRPKYLAWGCDVDSYRLGFGWSSSWSRCRRPGLHSCPAGAAATCWSARASAVRSPPPPARLKAPARPSCPPALPTRSARTTGSGTRRLPVATSRRSALAAQWKFLVGVSDRALSGAC